MKILKKLISVSLIMQVIATCGVSTASGLNLRGINFVRKGHIRPNVSVIVPVYNVEPYICECLDSLKNQTLKDIEIICVDDGSPDNCGKILDEYASKDKRFVVIHQENAGVSVARNAGLERATGEYITFADPDDYLELNAYEIAYNAIKKDNADIIQWGHRRFTENGHSTNITNNCIKEEVIDRDNFMLSYANDYVWNKFYKSNLIKNYKIEFIPKMRVSQDASFTNMVQARVNKVKVIPNILYNYRARKNSACRKLINQDEQIVCNYKSFRPVCDCWKKVGCSTRHGHVLLTHLIRRTNFFRPSNLKYAKEILDSFGPEIYNPETVKKCDDRTQKLIRELEKAANRKRKNARYVTLKKGNAIKVQIKKGFRR